VIEKLTFRGIGLKRDSISKETIRRMAELLKSGATMLSMVCPKCKSPLYRLKTGEIICPNCGIRYYVVTEEERESDVLVQATLDQLERNVLKVISDINARIGEAIGDDVSSYGKSLSIWLDVLERIERIKRSIEGRRSTS